MLIECNELKFDKYYRFIKDIIIFIVANVVSKLLQFLLMPFYTTFLTPVTFGTAELINNFSELLYPITTLCLYESAFRFAVDLNIDNSKLISTIFRIFIYSSILGFSLAIFGYYFFEFKLSFFLFFIVYLLSLKNIFAYYARGKGLSRVFAISGIVETSVLCILSIFFIITMELQTVGYLLAIIFSYLFSILYLYFKGNIYKELKKIKIDIRLKRQLLKYSVPLIVYNIMYWINTLSSRYILLFYTTLMDAGIYIATVKITAVINMLQQGVVYSFQLSASREFYKQNRDVYYSQIIQIFTSLYFFVATVVILLMPLFGKSLLRNEFEAGIIYLPILIIGAVLNCISGLYGTLYRVYKNTSQTIKISAMGAIVNVAFCIYLIPNYGLLGVCIANVLSYMTQWIYRIHDVKKFTQLNSNKWITLLSIILLIILSINEYIKTNEFNLWSLFIGVILIIINLFWFIKIILEILKSN